LLLTSLLLVNVLVNTSTGSAGEHYMDITT
jgi:hypothetical protein